MTLKGHEGYVLSADYSPDGKRIATAGRDGIVQIYTTDINELLQIAESRVTRQLTAEEKDKYGVLDWESTTYTYRYPRNRYLCTG